MADKPKPRRIKPGIFDEFMSEDQLNDPDIQARRQEIRDANEAFFASDMTGAQARHEDEMKSRANELRRMYQAGRSAKAANSLPPEAAELEKRRKLAQGK